MTEQIFLGSQDNLKMTVAHICGTSAAFTGDKKSYQWFYFKCSFSKFGGTSATYTNATINT